MIAAREPRRLVDWLGRLYNASIDADLDQWDAQGRCRAVADSYLAIQVVMMPRDTNPHGTIFGGVILSHIDQAGAIGARREVARAGGPLPFLVTVAINRVEFHKPVLVGDVVRFMTRLVRIGRTSITMHITVEVDRANQSMQVTEAEVVYVGIDPASLDRRPLPLLPDNA